MLTKIKTDFKVHMDINIIFYLALGLYYFNGIINGTTLTDVSGIPLLMTVIKWTVFVLLLWKIVLQKYTARSLCKIAIVGCIILLSYYFCRWQDVLVFGFLFIVAAKGIDLRKVAKEILIITFVTVLFVIILAEAGMIESITQKVSSSSRTYLWSAGNTIKLWGFEHHNYFGSRVLTFLTCYVFLRYEKFKIYDLIPCFALFYFCYFVVKTRTAAILILLVIFLVLLFKFLKFFGERKNKNLVRVGVYFIMAFSVIFSLFMCITYNSGNSIYIFFDSLLTTRISSAHSIFSEYGFSLFGQNVELISTITAAEEGVSAIVMDNAYMHLFVRCGVLVGILVLLGYFVAVKLALEEKNYGVLVVIAVYFVCGISETWLFTISQNPFLLLLSVGLYNQNLNLSFTDDLLNKKRKIVFKRSSAKNGMEVFK